jgi:hypothetical protein
MDTKLSARYAIRETMGIVVMGVALFWSAGRIDWWPAIGDRDVGLDSGDGHHRLVLQPGLAG